MKIRELLFEDTFLLSEIIDKMDLQADLNKLFDDAKKHPDAQAYLGGQLILSIVKRIHKAKDEITLFIANITDSSVEDIKKLKMSEIIAILKDLFKDEQFQDFFKRV
jgi:hypothetical protein